MLNPGKTQEMLFSLRRLCRAEIRSKSCSFLIVLRLGFDDRDYLIDSRTKTLLLRYIRDNEYFSNDFLENCASGLYQTIKKHELKHMGQRLVFISGSTKANCFFFSLIQSQWLLYCHFWAIPGNFFMLFFCCCLPALKLETTPSW